MLRKPLPSRLVEAPWDVVARIRKSAPLPGSPHAKRRASGASDNRAPASLSSTRTPGGRFLQRSVTFVPPGTASKVAMIVISPRRGGSVAWRLAVSTILAGGASSTKRTVSMSSRGPLLPRERSVELHYLWLLGAEPLWW
jgi:hypothetical protein